MQLFSTNFEKSTSEIKAPNIKAEENNPNNKGNIFLVTIISMNIDVGLLLDQHSSDVVKWLFAHAIPHPFEVVFLASVLPPRQSI